MLVILRENVENLGQVGDVVRVSPGYARNFLLPRKLVMLADEGNVALIEQQKKAVAKRLEAIKAEAQGLADKLATHTVVIPKKVGEGDKIYGSVSSAEIADELKKAGFKIERRTIHMDQTIKTLGLHHVTLKLAPEVSAKLQVSVVKES